MKLVGLRAAKQGLSALVADAQKERVVLTRHGRPAAVLIGVEGQDLENIMLAADPRFWRWIEGRRRQGATLALAEVEARYSPGGSRPPRRARRTTRGKRG